MAATLPYVAQRAAPHINPVRSPWYGGSPMYDFLAYLKVRLQFGLDVRWNWASPSLIHKSFVQAFVKYDSKSGAVPW